jgi:hypothetical protein
MYLPLSAIFWFPTSWVRGGTARAELGEPSGTIIDRRRDDGHVVAALRMEA